MKQCLNHMLAVVIIMTLMSCSCLHAMKLAVNGKARVSIVLGDDAISAEKTAASQLAIYLKKITGADFAIISKNKPNIPAIYVGQTSAVKSLLPGYKWDSLRQDGILIKSVGNSIVLTGDRPRGSLYAVYTFLEDYLGCRYWTPKVESVPKNATLTIPKISFTYTPRLFYRETWFQKVIQQNPAFCVKMKLNGHFNNLPDKWGGSHFFVGWCHTFGQFIPEDKYFAQHPEWFSEIGGKRVGNMSQLCLTNPEMKKELIKNALAAIKARPNAAIISISQNDYPTTYCQCEKCRAAVAKYGGIQSGLVLEFVNSVAEEIEKVYPKIWVETLAYQFSRKPPINIVPRKNVLIRLCTLECDFSQPLTSETNKAFHDDIVAWRKIAPRMFIWDYTINFGEFHLPHPNINILPVNMKFFADNNAVGIFEQGDGFNQNVQFTPLRTYLAAKYIWNPNIDAQKVKLEFLNGYYGKAGPYLNEYIKLLQTAVQRDKYYLKYHQRTTPYLHAQDYIDAFKLFNKAVDAVMSSPRILERVKTERRSLEMAFMMNTNAIKDEVYASKVIPPVDKTVWLDDFLKWAKDTRNNWAGDGGVPLDMKYFLQRGFAKSNGIKPAAISSVPDHDWMDVQDDLFELYGEGTVVKLVTDEKATDNSAARFIKCDVGDWAVQVPLFGPVNNDMDDVNIVVQLKMKAKGTNNAVKAGLYDFTLGKEIAVKELKANDLTDEYQDINLGKHKLTAGMKVYIAPMSNPDVESISVDRIYVYR